MSAQSGTFPSKAASRDRPRWRQRHELLRTGEHLLTYGLLFIVAIFVLLPLMWAFAASFTPNAKVFEYAFPFSLRACFRWTSRLRPTRPSLRAASATR